MTLNTQPYAVTVVLLVLARVAMADLFEVNDPNVRGNGREPQDGFNLTRDTDTGLDWLDLTLSDNRSFNTVSVELGAGGDYEGFRFATTPDLETLFDHAGLVLEDKQTPAGVAILDFLSFFGQAPPGVASRSAGRFDNRNGDPTLVGGAFVSNFLSGEETNRALVRINAEGRRGIFFFDPTSADPGFGVWLVRPSGDFNSDGILDAVDMDLLSGAVRALDYASLYDLDVNNVVDQVDRRVWVDDAFGTLFGDANLDRTVTFADFLLLSGHFNGQGGWGDGDFDGSGDVQFADFLLLSANYGKSASVAAVPEPDALVLFFIALLSLRGWRESRSRNL